MFMGGRSVEEGKNKVKHEMNYKGMWAANPVGQQKRVTISCEKCSRRRVVEERKESRKKAASVDHI
jgi:DNA-directed RNA polymerase subunit RPC12/RpoP